MSGGGGGGGGAVRYVHLDALVGRKVVDVAGRSAGRIEEVVAREEDGACVVVEYLLGRAGLLERLSVADLSLAALRGLGAYGGRPSHRVPWGRMDLSDPRRPRLTCRREELLALETVAAGAVDRAK